MLETPRKFTLEEILTEKDITRLHDLEKAAQLWKKEKHSAKLTALRALVSGQELILKKLNQLLEVEKK